MSTPIDPTSPSAPSIPTPATPLDVSGDQIRQLAAQLNQPPYNFDPATIRKAVITAIDAGDASTPPTGTILFSGDTTAPVSQVRLAAGYGPQVGDTVLVVKQGSDFFMLTDIVGVSNQTASSTAGGWTLAALQGAHSHNGNGNGNLMYRRTMDGGCWKMQWKGSIAYGGNTTVLLANLDPDFRPPTKVSRIAARDVNNGGAVAIGLDFQTDGGVTLIAANWSTGSASVSGSNNTDFVDPGDSTTTDNPGPHSHGVVGGHSHFVSISGGSHTHTASNPTWVSFHGVEYFLG